MTHAVSTAGPSHRDVREDPDRAPRAGARSRDSAPPRPTKKELQRMRSAGRQLRLVTTLLPDPAFEALLRRTQKPTRPGTRVVPRALVTRERIGRVDRETPGVPVTWIDRERSTTATVVHLHGGTYVAGERPEHWRWLEELRRRAGAAAAMIHYRMPPRSPFPVALDDAVTAIRGLLESGALRPDGWVLSGDSAGGGLALAVVQRLREEGVSLPSGVLLVSPWTDLTLTDPAVGQRSGTDVVLTRPALERCARAYAGEFALTDPRLSPRYGTVEDLPPMMLVAGSDEILVGDARALADALREAGVPVAFTELPEGQHDQPVMTDGPVAQWVLRRAIAFVRNACGLRD